jgi:hypothetical protein
MNLPKVYIKFTVSELWGLMFHHISMESGGKVKSFNLITDLNGWSLKAEMQWAGGTL